LYVDFIPRGLFLTRKREGKERRIRNKSLEKKEERRKDLDK